MSRHRLTRDDLDFAALAEELGTRLGRPVALSAREPADSPEGEDGVLVVLDKETGEEIAASAAVVEAAVAEHTPPAAPVDALDQFAVALESATTVAALRAALRDYARAARAERPARPRPPRRPNRPAPGA